MQWLVSPEGAVTGELIVPGDKSISHRAVILAALAQGTSHIHGLLMGDDVLATLTAMRVLGVTITEPEADHVIVQGVGLHGLSAPSQALDLGNSGTSMRLLAGVLAGQPFSTTLTGDASLSKRPMQRVAEPLRLMGAKVNTTEGKPPLVIEGGQPLKGIHYTLPMASAQVKSCLLLAGLYASGETTVTEPAITRDHSEEMLQAFGYPLNITDKRVSLSGGGSLQATTIDVPADISSAAFFMVAATIAPDSAIFLRHVGVNATRTGVISILQAMGAAISLHNPRTVGGEPVADIYVQSAALQGITIPAEQVPLAIDELPVLLVAAACAQGTTVLSNAEELRFKESDRIQAMADGLQTLGVTVQVTADGMRVQGQPSFSGGVVDSQHDHRIAMAFAVAALRATAPITLQACETVATSFPGFVELASTAGMTIEVCT